MQTVLEKLSESTASEAASHWAELRTILARADRPERGDVPRLAKLTGELGIDHSALPGLIEVLREFAGLGDASERAGEAKRFEVEAAGTRDRTAKAIEDELAAHRQRLAEVRTLAIRAAQYFADAQRNVREAEARVARRLELARQFADLLGTHTELAAIDAAAGEAARAEAERERQRIESEAVAGALGADGISPLLPPPTLARVVDRMAREGRALKGDVDPASADAEAEIGVGYGESGREVERLVWARRVEILDSLAAPLTVTAAREAGPEILKLARERGLLPHPTRSEFAAERTTIAFPGGAR